MAKEGKRLAAKTKITLAGLTSLFTNVRGMFLTLDGSRKVAAGLLIDGASDEIGFTKVTITEDMVGREMAIFTAIEIKAGRDRLSKEQRHFLQTVRENGGIAGVVRDDTDPFKIIEDYVDNRHRMPL